MKVFVFFFAMLLLLSSFMCFSADMGRYVRLQSELKNLAEDCAAGLALLTDAEEYSKGNLVIDRSAAESFVSFMLKAHPKLSASFESDGRSSLVVISYSGPDIFRLPFLKVESFSRSAVYRWE